MITPINTSPGTMKSIYTCPCMVPILGPIKFPNIRKYKQVVMMGGTMDCFQTRKILYISLRERVSREIRVVLDTIILIFLLVSVAVGQFQKQVFQSIRLVANTGYLNS